MTAPKYVPKRPAKDASSQWAAPVLLKTSNTPASVTPSLSQKLSSVAGAPLTASKATAAVVPSLSTKL